MTVSVPRELRRLLIVTNRLPVSAADPASPFVIDFIRALKKAGVEVAVFTSKIGEQQQDLGFPVVRFAWGENSRTLSELSLTTPTDLLKIKRYFTQGSCSLLDHLKKEQYDHLLALWALPSGWFALRAFEELGICYSVWALGSDINVWSRRPLAGGMIRRALRSAQALFADGDELAEKVSRISGRECRFLPSFHRLNRLLLPTAREKFFLYLGRLDRKKGVYDLLKAFARIYRDIWDYRLIYLGDGPEYSCLRKTIDAYELRGKAHVLGRVPTDEVINYLQRARAIVMPTHSDSIPLVFGEALQTATPMVVTNVGDLGNLVRDNKLGFAVRKKSPRELADAMVKMIVNEMDIRASAMKLIERFSPEQAVKTFLETIGEH